MVALLVPVSATFELQRAVLEQGQQALEASITFQTDAGRSLVEGLERQQRIQRRTLALQHVAVHRICDRIEEYTPEPNPMTDAVRDVVDENFDQLYELSDETFERLASDLDAGVDAYDDVSADYLDALEEQAALLVRTLEKAESSELSGPLTTQLDALVDSDSGHTGSHDADSSDSHDADSSDSHPTHSPQ